MTAVVCVWVGGWLGVYWCVCRSGCRKSMSSGGIYFGLLNCCHSVYIILNKYWFST